MNYQAGVLALAWLLLACGGTSGQSGAQGGEGAAGGDGSGAGQAQAGQTQGDQTQGGMGAGGVSENAAGESAGGEANAGPPAQGAAIFSVKAASPQPAGKACPTTAITVGIPDTSATPAEALTDVNYQHNVVDGEDGATVSCRVAPSGGFTFEGQVRRGGQALHIAGGELPAQGSGSAMITIVDSTHLSPSLLSSAEPCVVSAMSVVGNLQIKAGSMWASFDCAAVEALPTSSCEASGYFVLENCQQD